MDLQKLQEEAHEIAVSKGFWDKERNNSEMLMLMVSELGEACEGLRHGDWANAAEELADTVIRIMDFCQGRNINLEKEIIKKMGINKTRPKLHGKQF